MDIWSFFVGQSSAQGSDGNAGGRGNLLGAMKTGLDLLKDFWKSIFLPMQTVFRTLG